MSFNNFNGSIYVEYNKNSSGGIDVQQIPNEWTIVQEIGCSMLSQIPYQQQRVLLKNEADINMREVFDDDEIGVNDFKVSYTHGLIWYHPSQVGKSFKATFGGIGVQYISGNRVLSGIDSNGRPVVQSDIVTVINDYNNRIKPEFKGIKDEFKGLKDDYQLTVKDNYQQTVKDDYATSIKQNYQTNIIDNYETTVKNDYKSTVKNDYSTLKQNYKTDIVDNYNSTVKQDYKTTVKDAYKLDVVNPWQNELKPELKNAIDNYHNSTNPTWITTATWTKTITEDNTGIFQLDLSSFNPVADQVNKFAYQSSGQEGCIELIKDEHWTIVGATITLSKNLVFMRGDKVFINVYRGVATTPIAGTNGGDLQNGSVTESKLAQDVQDKLNNVYYENTLNFVATIDNTTQFTIADSTFNPVTDKLKIYQDNMLIQKDDNYTLNGMVVTLAEALNIGDKIYYEIGKNIVSSIDSYMTDGGLVREGSISKEKLTKDVKDELEKIPLIISQLAEKANIVSVNEQFSKKRNLMDKIKSSELDTSSNENKIKPINVSDELMAMFSPSGSVSPIIPNDSLVTEKYAPESVTHFKRTVMGQFGILLSNSPPNFDFKNKKLILKKASRIRYDRYVVSLNNDIDTVIDIDTTGLSVIYYDIKENKFIASPNFNNSANFTENSIYLGQYNVTNKTGTLNTSSFTIDDEEPLFNTINNDRLSAMASFPIIMCPVGYVDFDFDVGKFILPFQANGKISIQYKNTFRQIDTSLGNLEIDITKSGNQACIIFNIDDLTFRTENITTIKSNSTNRDIIIALYDLRGQTAMMVGTYKVNGKFLGSEGIINQIQEGEVRLSNVNWQDTTFIKDVYCGFRASDDATAIEPGIGVIYLLNLNESNTYYKMLKHNFGHCNTVDYNENNNSLIIGNGSGTYGTDGEIIIFQGVDKWLGLPNNTVLDINGITGTDIVRIPLGRSIGDKVNVCWGESNIGNYNICYVISNDNKNIRKVLLGRGSETLPLGIKMEGKSTNQFNGTYRIIKEYSTDDGIDVNQGSCYHNGYLYLAIGHLGNDVVKCKLNDDGTIMQVRKQEIGYNTDGTTIKQASEGICIKNGIIHHTTFGTMTRLYKYLPF